MSHRAARKALAAIRRERARDTEPPEVLAHELARHERIQRRAQLEAEALKVLGLNGHSQDGGKQ